MRIVSYQKKMRLSGAELLSVSRVMRQAVTEIGSIEAELRNLSGLTECRNKLKQQKAAVERLTGRVVTLSTSLYEITDAYQTAEERNERTLEEMPALRSSLVQGKIYTGTNIHQVVTQILGK